MKVIPAYRRWWDWPAALLFLIAALTSAARLVVTEWTPILPVVQTITFLGVIAGLAIGVSRFSPRTSFWLAFDYGVFVIAWQLGRTVIPDDATVELLWSDRLLILMRRLATIAYQLINRITVMDSLLFVVVMCILFWALAAAGGYALARHGEAWRALLPLGAALLVIQYYDPLIVRRAWYLAFFIFFGLTLVARMAFVHSQARWRDTRTGLPPHLSLDFIRYTALVVSILVALAWTVPAMANAFPAAERLARPVRNLWSSAQSRMDFAFASLRSTSQVFSPVYGNNAALGSGNQLSDVPIFTAHAPLDLPSGARIYWRARHFDEYRDGQWFSNIDTLHPYDPGEENLATAPTEGRWVGEFDMVSAVVMGTMFTPPQPLWLSHAGSVQYETNPDGTLDISSFIATPAVLPSQMYRVRASLAAPTVEQMRAAGSAYPDYIAERYLQLPASLTARTRQLAQDITAGAVTPYDKAQAITVWLRENMVYTQEIQSPLPSGQEPIDWFLFDLKQGFCNYYATAEIVMLRSLGIPARWAAGYAQGEALEIDERQSANRRPRQSYLIRQKDAHAWPEVYFPGIGWVEFEPTAAQPNITRLETRTSPALDIIPPDANERSVEPEMGDEPTSPDPTAAQQTPVGQRLGQAALALLLVGVLLWALEKGLPRLGAPSPSMAVEWAITRLGFAAPRFIVRLARRAEAAPRPNRPPVPVLLERAMLKLGLRPPQPLQRWSRYAQLPPIAQAYTEINRTLGWMGLSTHPHQTPQQRALAVAAAIPPAQAPAQALAHEYQLSIYARAAADESVARQAASDLRRAGLRAWGRRLLARFQAPAGRKS